MFAILGLMFAALGMAPQDAPAPAAAPGVAPDTELWRLDCGTLPKQQLGFYDDAFGHDGQTGDFASGCYLIRHGDRYLLWDTGLSTDYLGDAPATDAARPRLARSIRDQLAEIGVAPEAITLVGISHYHWDHSGQLSDFPDATLMIGAQDWEAIAAGGPALGLEPALFAHFVSGGGTVRPVRGDADVFGDGSVRMIALPGHTPGHHGLLVRLPQTGAVLLTGDLAHFAANYADTGVPLFNTDRADSLASFDRFKAIARNLDATVVIQHEAADVATLPPFPESAR